MKVNGIIIEKRSVTIKFKSERNIKIRNLVSIGIDNKERYFEVSKIEVNYCENTNQYITLVEATEKGYYDLILESDINYVDIIGLDINIVNDQKIIQRIDDESGYC